jgi:hypothetical protein
MADKVKSNKNAKKELSLRLSESIQTTLISVHGKAGLKMKKSIGNSADKLAKKMLSTMKKLDKSKDSSAGKDGIDA